MFCGYLYANMKTIYSKIKNKAKTVNSNRKRYTEKKYNSGIQNLNCDS